MQGSVATAAAAAAWRWRTTKEEGKRLPSWLRTEYLVTRIGYADAQAQRSPVVLRGSARSLHGRLLRAGDTAPAGSAA